jgi:hypothetical protein
MKRAAARFLVAAEALRNARAAPIKDAASREAAVAIINSEEYCAGVERAKAEYVAAKLEYSKLSHEAGNKLAVLHAIDACATAGLPLPQWAADAFCKAFDEVRFFRCASWDEVFGVPIKKHEKLPAKEQQSRLQIRVWVRVSQLREATPRRNVFPEVAAEFKIGVAMARKHFFAAEKKITSGTLEGAAAAQHAEGILIAEELKALARKRR